MAILKSTQIKGNLSVEQNLTVDGNLNVQGDLTYVGVNNLRVKDHQIELNSNDGGLAIASGEAANGAGIVFRGTTKEGSPEASILYNYADDTLVVNKTIEGTVSNATTAASANKVANILTVNVTDETGSLKTVEFDGSEVKTVDVNLKRLQDQINSLTGGGAGSVATQINNAIKELDVTDAAVAGQYVSAVSETDGKITVTRAALPDYTEVYDAKGSAAAVLGKADDDSTVNTVYGVKAYAKKYADGLAAGKANTVHTHEISNVNGLQTALDGKAAADHTHTNYDAHLADTVKHIAAEERTAWNAKQNALSEAQLAAANSGVTADKVSGYDAHVADTTKHITDKEREAWNAAEQNAKNYTNTKIGELGTAAKSNVLTGKIADSSSSNDLVTAAQVKTYVTDASADAVAKVVAGADSDFDTLKEVADWIKNDKTGAAALQTDVAGLKKASHTHANMAELNKIEDGDKAKWDGHVNNADIHVTAEQKTAWTAKQDALSNANVLKAITDTQVRNWDDAAAKAHEHTNKTVLDGITTEKVSAWDGAVSAARVSSVDGKSGALTLKGGSTKLGDVNLSISDGGQISAAIVPDSFDAFGSADAAKNAAIADAAKKYQVKGDYEIAGAAATAEQNAKTYADEKVAELKNTVDSLNNDVLKGVAAGDYVSVSTKSGNSQTISVTTEDVATASDTPKGLALAADVKKYVDGKNTEIENNYVKKAGDTMTGNLTMPSSGNKGIVFGDMKIVWNSTDSAIEFVPTTPTTA